MMGAQQCTMHNSNKSFDFIEEDLAYKVKMTHYPMVSVNGSCLLQLNFFATKRVKFEYGGVFSAFLQRFDSRLDTGNVTGRVITSGVTRLLYVKLPVTLQYFPINRQKLKWAIGGGPQIGMLLAERGAMPRSLDLLNTGGFYKNLTLDFYVNTSLWVKLVANIYWITRIHIDGNITHADRNSTYSSTFDYTVSEGKFLIHKPSIRHYTQGITTGFVFGLSKN
jgi:hypothetical protein